MGQEEDEVVRHLLYGLFDDKDRPDFRNFAGSRRLYSTNLDSHGLLLSIIDGVGRPAKIKYQTILDIVWEATGGPPAYWVVILCHDNMVAVVEAFWHAKTPWSRSAMELFEAQEGAQQGGQSFLALIPEGRDWLLWHCHDPCNDFTIDFFGTVSMCEELDRSIDQGLHGGDDSARIIGTPRV